jgi:hypothetical protein
MNPITHSISGSRIVPMNGKNLKKRALVQAKAKVEDQVKVMRQELVELQRSSEADTKSSMGDKYETSREMIQQERDKIMSQLSLLQMQLIALDQVNLERLHAQVENGSLVIASSNCYFICASLGIIKSEVPVFFISSQAPIAQALMGKKTGDEVTFNGQKFCINEIV